MEIICKLNNRRVYPVNLPDFELELNYDSDDPDALQIQVSNNWEFGEDGAKIINDHISRGLSGGVGMFEGIPYTVTIQDGDKSLLVLDSYIDLTDPANVFECDYAEVNSIERGGVDWLNDKADNVLYNILLENKTITEADKVQVPYVVSSVPDYKATAIASLTAYAVFSEIRAMIKELRDVLADLTGVTNAAAGVAKAVFLVVYIIASIVALIKLIQEIKDSLIQPVKYHAGMRLQKLLEAGAESIGMKFKSTLFNSYAYRNAVIIPAKRETVADLKKVGLRGFTTPSDKSNGYFEGTYRELLIIVKDLINGKFTIIGNTIHLERRDKNLFGENATYRLPPVEMREVRYNTDELISNHEVLFRSDLSDENTIANYSGTVMQAVTSPRTVINNDMTTVKGVKRTEIPLARGIRKTEFTVIEKLIDTILKQVYPIIFVVVVVANILITIRNVIISVIQAVLNALRFIGINIPFSPEPMPPIPYPEPTAIENRIGMLLLSNDYFEVPKILTLDISRDPRLTKVNKNNLETWRALNIYKSFYRIDSFVPSNALNLTNANQWERYSTEVTLCLDDVLKLKNNNHIFDADNRTGKLETLKWTPYKETASCNFRINKRYTSNLKLKLIEPNGL